MSVKMQGCHPDRPCRHGPTPTIVYVSGTQSDAEAEARANVCRSFASVRGWPLVGTVIETTPERPLEVREGWAKVLAAVSSGAAEVIATYDPAHLGLDVEGFEALGAHLREREVVLVAATGTPAPPPVSNDHR
ncbi:recombinase family protein [Streptomyces crystallinus]|uniref:Resolvase/invertase-type recombinase catalytic domain-containing protein n=1 Tax=Streptomyces crystallinus TaxID=68191 RepID=A0ABP3Q4E8_9ACTN